jgi:hypothetical protein
MGHTSDMIQQGANEGINGTLIADVSDRSFILLLWLVPVAEHHETPHEST